MVCANACGTGITIYVYVCVRECVRYSSGSSGETLSGCEYKMCIHVADAQRDAAKTHLHYLGDEIYMYKIDQFLFTLLCCKMMMQIMCPGSSCTHSACTQGHVTYPWHV
jgi:hypothetical protein